TGGRGEVGPNRCTAIPREIEGDRVGRAEGRGPARGDLADRGHRNRVRVVHQGGGYAQDRGAVLCGRDRLPEVQRVRNAKGTRVRSDLGQADLQPRGGRTVTALDRHRPDPGDEPVKPAAKTTVGRGYDREIL